MPKYLDGAGLSHFWESIKPKLGGVTKSGTGTVVSSDDAANLPPLSLTIHGKSMQDGTPSPSSPVEIQSVEGRNLQSPLFTSTRTVNGVTYTPNEDGTFTASGTATPSHSQVLSPRQYLPAGDYVISGCPQGGAGRTYYLSALCYSAQTGGTITASAYDYGSGASFTVPSGGGYVLSYCSVYKDTAAPDAVWKPMLERGSAATAYQPYQHIKAAVSGKNLLDTSIVPSSYAQVSYTNGSDGSIVLNGTKYGGGYYVVKTGLGLPLEGTYTLHATQISGTATNRPTIYLMDSDGNVLASASPASGNIEKATFTTDAVVAERIRFGLWTDNAVYTNAAYRIWLTAGSELTEYEQYVGSTVLIDLDGNAIRSLPDGTEDVLEVDGEGNVTLTKRIGLTTTATTDGISATVGTDAMSTTGDLSDGATVIYKLATPQTISLGKIDLPSLPSPSFSMHVDALVTPTLDAEWLTEGGGKVVEAVSTRISALESEVGSLQADVTELQGQVPEREVLYDTSTWTIVKYGRTVMVQVHGATATPSTSTALVTGILSDCKPAYNCSATVLTSSGSSTQAARMAVYADTGNVYIVPAGYSSSASWYGTLTYIY